MRKVLVHAHIFKNAGTTFDFSLRRFFGEGFVDHREDAALVAGRNAYLLDYLAGNPGVNSLSTHSLYFHVIGNEEIELVPVYFLRHPVARVWSVYQFEKRQTGVDTQGAKRAKELNLNDYVEWYLEQSSPATIRNIHTIFLSGGGPGPVDMASKFAAARDYLAGDRCHLAIVERYDDSMLLLEEALAPDFPGIDLSYVRKNVTTEDPDAVAEERANELLDHLDESVAEKLIEANDYDLRIYREVIKRIDEKIAENVIEDRRSDFQERCRKLQMGQD